MDYEIRYAEVSDIDSIMRFIDENWKKDHILSRNRELFEWQYGGEDNRINMIIGLDSSKNIQGLIGFISYGNNENSDIALAMWKANKNTGFLGIRLLAYLLENKPHREVVCPGINPYTTQTIYERMGMNVGIMTQWYRLACRKEYRIASILDDTIPEYSEETEGILLSEVLSYDDLPELFNTTNDDYLNSIPFKSLEYIKKRYFLHPVYDYKVFAIKGIREKADTLIIFRVQECNGSKALRVIDCIGTVSDIGLITEEIDRLLRKYDCEYADLYETGLSHEMMTKAGWLSATDEENIIPDYFSPYECRKVNIYFSSSSYSAVLFKGDGDQDRPN